MNYKNDYFSKIISILLLITSYGVYSHEANVLTIAGWDVYADPDKPNKTIGYESFEKATGVKIDFTPLSNLDDIISFAESDNEQDIYLISNEGIEILHDMGLVSPINLSLIPHYQDLHHNLKYSEWSQFKSRIYAVPWAWGPTGLLYDKEQMPAPDSWNVLWDPKYAGKVSMWNDVSMIWTTALALGYQNVYSLTKTQLEAVKHKLLELNKHSPIYYESGGEEVQLAKSGKIIAFNSWYNPSEQLQKSGKDFAMTIPKEGAVGMFDSYMISKGSHMSELSHQFINHQISPEIQTKLVHITGLAPSNLETLGMLNRDQIRALHLDDPDYFNRMLLWDHMPRKNLYEKVLQEVRDDFKNRGK